MELQVQIADLQKKKLFDHCIPRMILPQVLDESVHLDQSSIAIITQLGSASKKPRTSNSIWLLTLPDQSDV